ncbi:MAG: RNA methyltransferase [Paludibacteraceae bacterium]|jgi:tRNA G18 (ribose-2'-O)-methylase SpoU|nr:RNA methyltransferase [Paludibacteraceae bacterium]MDI9536395.1 RNA methyltransferase [Bacteroidota bacterium]HHT61620.1 RNA methyltransferase [Bacteroidales bacterium]MBP9038874.1 RNA methyltransferase [Paludibacteraceae bacterium]HOH71672.1 RNA methyltransferase [Paludibacteraceae bacterium]
MKKLTIEELDRISVEEFKQTSKIPLIIVLDNVRSLYNVGSIFRTADAYLVKKIILCGISATPPNVEIHKTALGAENTVEWDYYAETLDAVVELRKNNVVVFAVEQVKNSVMLTDLKLDKNKCYAAVFGNEVKGVQQSVVDACDGSVELPQFGTKHSLNVSTTAGIVIWDFWKQLK